MCELPLHWIEFPLEQTINIAGEVQKQNQSLPSSSQQHPNSQYNIISLNPFLLWASLSPTLHQTFPTKSSLLVNTLFISFISITPQHSFTYFPNWVLIKIWFFCLFFSESHEFQELGGFLGLLCQPAFQTIHEEVALCGHALQYLLLALFFFLQLVVLVLCALFWVWLCLVQSLLCGRECSGNFWTPLLVALVWF